MKKLLLGLGIVSIVAACNNPEKKQLPAAPRLAVATTLNGLTYIEAQTMINRFIKGKATYDKPTSIWFNIDTLNAMYLKMMKDKGDGIRFYFARKANSDATVVIVSTHTKPAPDPHDPPIHADFLNTYSALVDLNGLKGEHHYDEAGGAARLYTDTITGCPLTSSCIFTTDQGSLKLHDISCQDALKAVTNFSEVPVTTKGVWYEAFFFKQLIAEVKADKGDGVRLYFAEKDDLTHTVILVTTRLDGIRHTDYFDCPHLPVQGTDDNGEQCPYACSGLIFPDSTAAPLVKVEKPTKK